MRNPFAMVLFCVLCQTTPGYGQAPTAASLLDLAREEFKNHHYDQSEKLFKAALDAKNIDDVVRGAILSDLGTLYLDEERLADAEQAFTKALSIFRRTSYSNQTALLLRHLGAVYSVQRRHEEANKTLNQAWKLAKSDKAVTPKVKVEIVNSLGVAYFRQGKTGKAEKLFRQGLALTAAESETFEVERTTLLNNLGGVYCRKRDFARAEALLTESLTLTEKRFGTSDPVITYTLNTLGVLYIDMRRYADAERQYKRAVAILEQSGMDFDPRLARALKGLSDTYLKAGKLDEAERALRRAISIARPSLTTHPDMAGILESYSNLLNALGKSSEAQQLYFEARRARATMALTFRAYY